MTNKDRKIILSRFLEIKGVENKKFKDFVVTKNQFKEKVKSLKTSELELILKGFSDKPTEKELVNLYDEFDEKEIVDLNKEISKALSSDFDTDDKAKGNDFEDILNNISEENETSADEVFGENPKTQDPEDEAPEQSKDIDGDDESDSDNKADSDKDDESDNQGDSKDKPIDEDKSDDSKSKSEDEDSLENQIKILMSQNLRLTKMYFDFSKEYKKDSLKIISFNDYQIEIMNQAIEYASKNPSENIPYEFQNIVENISNTMQRTFTEVEQDPDIKKRNQLILIRIFKSAFTLNFKNVKKLLPKLYLTKDDISNIEINKTNGSVKIEFKNSSQIKFINRQSENVMPLIKSFNEIETDIEKFNKQLRQETVTLSLSELLISKFISDKKQPNVNVIKLLPDPNKII